MSSFKKLCALALALSCFSAQSQGIGAASILDGTKIQIQGGTTIEVNPYIQQLKVTTCKLEVEKERSPEICVERKIFLNKKEIDALSKSMVDFLSLTLELEEPKKELNKVPSNKEKPIKNKALL